MSIQPGLKMEVGRPAEKFFSAVLTRREFGVCALATPLAAGTKRNGVTIGIASYSFRDRPLDAAIDAMRRIGFQTCALWQGHVEPRASRDERRKWRCTVPLDEFARVREKFARAGISVYAYYYDMRDDCTEEEIARGFAMGKALGVRCLESSPNRNTVPRIERHAARANMLVAVHNHARLDPNEFARPEDFEAAMRGHPHIRINLDIGHLGAVGVDPLPFIRRHHSRIMVLDLKDRRRDQTVVPFGEGDSNVAGVLRLLRDKRYAFPAMIEYEYKGTDAAVEVQRSLDYCKRVLA